MGKRHRFQWWLQSWGMVSLKRFGFRWYSNLTAPHLLHKGQRRRTVYNRMGMGLGRIYPALYFWPSRRNQKAHKKEIAKRKNYLELQSKAHSQCYSDCKNTTIILKHQTKWQKILTKSSNPSSGTFRSRWPTSSTRTSSGRHSSQKHGSDESHQPGTREGPFSV